MPARRTLAVVRLLLVTAVASFASGAATPKLPKPRKPPKPVVYGTYEVECRGYYVGRLKATVGPGLVTITGDVTSEDGKKATVLATAPLVGYRFTGVGTAGPGALKLNGRVDPPDDMVVKPRLVCTWSTAPTNETGRMVGAQ